MPTTEALPTRDAISASEIAALRRRFPTEPETEALLERKMAARADGPYRRPTLAQMTRLVTSFLEDRLETPFRLEAPRWSSGGVSKIQMVFTLDWLSPDRGQVRDEMVVRMDPDESLNATSRVREYEVLGAVASHLPVPEVFWIDAGGTHFPQPALVYAFVEGVSKPPGTGAGQVTGLGTNFGEHFRPLLAPQFMTTLATIHTLQLDPATVPSMAAPEPGTTQAALLQLNRARRVWEEDRAEDVPLMDVAAAWLEENVPVTDRISLVHGDFRSGNFLFDPDTADVTAWLDWERCHLGDRHRDLAWTTQLTFGHWEGDRYLVCGLIPLDEFYEQYESASGLRVDPARLHYFRVLNAFQILAALVGTGHRVIRLRKSHQGISLARLRGQAASISDDLRRLLEEGAHG
ncbi:MAG: putative aminoglycoside phosphotransferase [Nocardioidaceae bacterium]|nr:putative aminoglycoside phosphotransferase [Nocardioidaceae bacterium]